MMNRSSLFCIDANKNWKGFTLGDDIEDAVASASSLKNTCYNMDMNMLLVCDQMSMEVLSVAAYLGLFTAPRMSFRV